jgi:site-specific DNA-methyltransferase (adenine-specific)
MNEGVWLMHGDCLERMKEIPDGSVDLVLADPPFGTTQCKWDSIIDLDLMWDQLKRVIKPNGAILLFGQTPFDKVLGCSNLPMLKYEWIWEKTSATGHLNVKRSPMKAHENILVFYKKPPTYNGQKTTGHKRKTSKTGKTYNSACYGAESKKPDYDSDERHPRSVQVFKSDKQKSKLVPTQKPLALMEYLMKTYSNEGEVVLDFTAGSFTTGVACVNLNRKFIGIEMDETYFNIGVNRIEERIKCLDLKTELMTSTED